MGEREESQVLQSSTARRVAESGSFGLSGLSGLFDSTNERDKTDPRARVLKEDQRRRAD